MSEVSRNAIANYTGQAWAALIGIAFVPIYIRYVGIEAYGVIGFFVALQAFSVILDMGLSASLNRELAMRSAKTSSAQEARDLVRTLEYIYWPIGAFIAIAVWWVSDPIAEHWLRPVSLSIEQSSTAIFLLGLATALHWPVSFYSGGLAGLQRQVMLNVLVVAFATIRAAGAVFVLALIAPTLEAFLWWQIVVSAAQSIAYAAVTWRVLPKGERSAQFRIDELRKIGRFATGVTGIAIVSFLLTQSDRVILSKILPLDEFGVYAFASTLALALLRLVHPIVTAVYPRYSQLAAAEDSVGLADFYHRTNQIVAAGLLPIAAVLAIFAQDVIYLWTGDRALSAASAPIFVLLLAGSAINGLMNLPYALQLAYGWISLAFWINLVSVFFLVPATWIMGREFGGVGAASIWLVLNIGYLVIGIPLMHRRLLRDQMWRWYLRDIGPPFVLCACAALIWKAAIPRMPDGLAGWLLLSVVTATITAGSIAISPYPRRIVRYWWSTVSGSSG